MEEKQKNTNGSEKVEEMKKKIELLIKQKKTENKAFEKLLKALFEWVLKLCFVLLMP